MNPDQNQANQYQGEHAHHEHAHTHAHEAHQHVHHHQKNTAMAILSYLGPLVIVSYAMAKSDPFVKYHIKQGLVLLVLEVIVWILSGFFWPSYALWMVLRLVNLGTLILAIIGIIYAAKGEEKELPVVGSFAKNFKF